MEINQRQNQGRMKQYLLRPYKNELQYLFFALREIVRIIVIHKI